MMANRVDLDTGDIANQKMKIGEQRCSIYQNQLRSMQNLLYVYRNTIHEKEHIIDNLMDRYEKKLIPSAKLSAKKDFFVTKATALATATEIHNNTLQKAINMIQLKILFGLNLEQLIPYKLNKSMRM
eukprot:738307_1